MKRCVFSHSLTGQQLSFLRFQTEPVSLFCGYLSSLLCPPSLRCPWSSQHPCSTQPLPFPLTVVSGWEICSHTLELCCSLLALSHQTCLPCQTTIVVLENLHLQKKHWGLRTPLGAPYLHGDRTLHFCYLDLVLLIKSENARSSQAFNSITNSLVCHLYSSCTFSLSFFPHSLAHPFGCSWTAWTWN